jgi:Protein of unknown function (DUF3426)/zinc-ribbon domain
MFNVVADQLKVSQGWVRCGQCADVFEATLHLQNESAPSEPQPPKVLADESLLSPIVAAGVGGSSYAQEVTAALKTPDDEKAAEKADQALLSQPVEVVQANEPVVVDARDDISSEVPSDVAEDVSFVRDARRQAFWRRPLVRSALSILALLLIGLLALQVAVMQRDSLAAWEPRLKPALQVLCERLACQVGPVRQIEAIVIDSSSFNKVNESGLYRLSFVLKNTGATAVAMPSLEVTLTDTQDQPVLRRVLSPAQLGAANGMLVAGTEFTGALGLQVAALATASDNASPSMLSRVAGYRLLAFYP